MKKPVIILTFLFFCSFVAGCGISIIPRPLSPTDRVNLSDRSITKEDGSLSLSVRVQDTAVGGYDLATPLTSFYVDLLNKGRKSITLPLTSFVLVDDQGSAHKAVSPSDVNNLLSFEIDFLQPFPFVSFLDVAQQESQRAASGMASERPYVGHGLELKSAGTPFPESAISPGARGSGVVFFEIDLSRHKTVQFQVSNPVDNSVSIFPFAIE